jgi:hypothetical protein
MRRHRQAGITPAWVLEFLIGQYPNPMLDAGIDARNSFAPAIGITRVF